MPGPSAREPKTRVGVLWPLLPNSRPKNASQVAELAPGCAACGYENRIRRALLRPEILQHQYGTVAFQRSDCAKFGSGSPAHDLLNGHRHGSDHKRFPRQFNEDLAAVDAVSVSGVGDSDPTAPSIWSGPAGRFRRKGKIYFDIIMGAGSRGSVDEFRLDRVRRSSAPYPAGCRPRPIPHAYCRRIPHPARP